MIEDSPLPENKEQLIARVSEQIRGGKLMVMAVLDNSEHLIVSSMGVHPNRLAELMRHFAEQLEREQAMEQARKEIEALPPDRKGNCPSCNMPVIVTTPIPERAIRRQGKTAICVCTCGAFLVPFLHDDSPELQLRLMTEEEIAEIPDKVRHEMLRVRRQFEQLRGELRQ